MRASSDPGPGCRLPPAPEAGEDAVRSLYVHAPFCARRCPYCHFAVQVARRPPLHEWLRALEGELRILAREETAVPAGSLETLYVGGGTPSVLGPAAMEALGRVVGPRRLRDPGLEWSAEANPESFTVEVARAWRDAGVGRVSLGVQSFHEGALRWMGRLHGPEGAERAVDAARKAGFREISIDLLFGLPERLGRSWDEDLDRALALDVPHISLYGLSAEEETPLVEWVRSGRVSLPDEERYREQYLQASQRLSAAGYEHYEVSNFARPGSSSLHNRIYWSGGPYLGLGNSAHSYLPPVRRWNLGPWEAYRTAVARGEIPLAGREELSPEDLRLERIWLALRTRDGLPVEEIDPGGSPVVEGWLRKGWAVREGARIRLSPEGWLLLDRLAVELDAACDGGRS